MVIFYSFLCVSQLSMVFFLTVYRVPGHRSQEGAPVAAHRGAPRRAAAAAAAGRPARRRGRALRAAVGGGHGEAAEATGDPAPFNGYLCG